MKKALAVFVFFLASCSCQLLSQPGNDTIVYLLTCGPGTETYSIYGHSALRIKYKQQKRDLVYNWGVFDFDTPNFLWKFAKGRLDYMLAVESLKSFLQEYFYEKRYVLCQQLNLTSGETADLVAMINENLKPQNIRYRYDFFYDNCSTRIRDLIEKTIGKDLLYTAEKENKPPTFRQLIGKYQRGVPWLRFGIDLLLGSPVDKITTYRERMFLPMYLQSELSESVVNRDSKMVPLLQNPETMLDFEPPAVKQRYLTLPSFVFTLVLIIILTVCHNKFVSS